MSDVYAIKVKKNQIPLSKELLNFVSEKKKEKINNSNSPNALHSVIGELLVRMLVTKKTGLSKEEIDFFYNNFGKPFLKDYGLYFNISHSGDWVVCALDTQPVGIDIEQIRNIDLSLIYRCLSKSEINFIESLDDIYKIPNFYELWTAKESYVKAIGKGIHLFPDFTITLKKDNIHLLNNSSNIFFNKYFIDPSYRLCVCSFNKNFTNKIKFISLQDIITFYKGDLLA